MARLLKGFTDLLQPINLAPNSDFSRSEGLPSSYSINLYDVGSNRNYLIRPEYIIYYSGTFNKDFKNFVVNVTITTNSIRIQGTIPPGSHVRNATTGGITIRLSNNHLYAKSGHAYTVAVDFKDNLNSGNVEGLSSYSSGRTYYAGIVNGVQKTASTMIGVPNSDQFVGFRFAAKSGTETISVPFDVTFSNFCLYEGAFTNPPVYKSLDVLLRNQFALKGHDIHTMKYTVRRGSGKWTTVARISPSTGVYGTNDYFMSCNKSSILSAMIHIRVTADRTYAAYIKTMYADGNGKETGWLSKIRISQYNSYLYLDILEGNKAFDGIVWTGKMLWCGTGYEDSLEESINYIPDNTIADSATSKYVLDNPWTIA